MKSGSGSLSLTRTVPTLVGPFEGTLAPPDSESTRGAAGPAGGRDGDDGKTPVAPSRSGPGPGYRVYLEAMEVTYFRKGFGLKDAIGGQLASDYASAIVDLLRARESHARSRPRDVPARPRVRLLLGVDRAVDYAYETRLKFPSASSTSSARSSTTRT
jgi:hypothetical protein